MNDISCKKYLNIIFLLYVPLIMLDVFGPSLTSAGAESFISTINYYALRILTLYVLFFTVYARFAGAKGTRRPEGPVTIIILSATAVIFLFGVPISNYLLLDTKGTALSQTCLDVIKDQSLNVNNTPGRRFLSAKDYFLETGERTPYSDRKGTEILYSPDENAFKLRQQIVKHRCEIDVMRADIKLTAFRLAGLLAFSVFLFLAFLLYKLKRER